MSDVRAHDWKNGLQRVGTYYEGYIDNIELVLEDYRRDTITSWGTRRSYTAIKTVTSEDKENISPCPNSEVKKVMQVIIIIWCMHMLIRNLILI